MRKDSKWLEHTPDWSMTLDVPSTGSKKTGLTNFDDTLDISLLNCITLLKTETRTQSNVLSGTDEAANGTTTEV